jgi:predicted aspartyl protease
MLIKQRSYFLLILSLTISFSSCFYTCGNTQVPRASLKFPENKSVVEIPFTKYRGWIIIKVSVNNAKDLSFILDTGAPIAVLSNADTNNHLHLKITGNAMVGGGDPNKPESVPLATSVKFKIGDIIIENGLMAVGAASETINGVDGIIGKYLFDDAVITIDWKRSKLVCTKPEVFKYNGTGEIIPIALLPSGHICTQINVQKNGKKISAMSAIDLGNRSNFSIYKEAESSIITNEKIIKNIIVLWGANGAATGDVTRTDVTINSIKLNDVITTFSEFNNRLIQEGINANIGLSILEKFTPTFNYSHNQLILEKNEKFADPFVFNRSGIILNPKREADYNLIADIIPTSSAQISGLQKNDRIISINEKKISSLSQDTIDSLIQGKILKTITLNILRSGSYIQTTIKMKDIL